ncbi:MAG: DNA repair protein RecN, partial [Gammaproteobacteria bacterium]|nr:DNA repair protein RecN [Gammaproteobacteria bacterium]
VGHRSLLKHLHIRDFAVIEELDIPFNNGMTVFTGETGAGKSIMVGALGLVLGDRSDSSIVRTGCERTEITAIFDIENEGDIPSVLSEQDIDCEDELILRRVINTDGRSRAYVNGSSVPVQLLRTLGECMVDIHGQHTHQSLLKAAVQRNLLDEFGNHPQQVNEVKDAWKVWHATELELQALSGENRDHDAQISLLQYQIQELEALNPGESTFSAIEEEYSRLANANRLLEVCQQTLQQLSDDERSTQSQISRNLSELQDVQKFDQSLSSVIELLNGAAIQIGEASDDLRHYLDRLELDPERLKSVEDQLGTFHDMARKHKIQPEALADHLVSLQDELHKLENSEARFKELLTLQTTSIEKYRKAAASLRQCRQRAAESLSKNISKKLNELGMPGGKFSIEISEIEKDTPLINGMDKTEYLVSLNPGQPLQPLSKVASGGELSRISLAIQVTGSKDKGIPTLIFDEVDSGIGGGVAEIVGKLLHSLSDKRQVFCVTHLAQVASQGDHHLQVAKETHAGTTLTRVSELNHEERIEEIARMLGGVKITEQTLAHAKEMFKS